MQLCWELARLTDANAIPVSTSRLEQILDSLVYHR